MSAVFDLVPPTNAKVIKRCNALIDSGNQVEALKVAEEYLIENPEDPQVLVILAMMLKKCGRLATAYNLAKRCSTMRPDRPEIWSCLGNCAQGLWRMDEAAEFYKKAVDMGHGKKKAIYLNNLGSVYIDTGRFKEGEPYIRQAMKIDPEDVLTRHNLGLSLLAQRQWREGWKNYSASVGTENRRKTKYMPDPGEPTWDGTKEKTVIVYGEQGLGDEVCAASMLPDVIRDSERVIIDCDKRLEGLFKRSFPKATVHGTRWAKQLDWPKEDRKIDYSVAGFEVAQFYRNEDSEFPGTPYLTPDPERVLMWKALWKSKKKPTIGVAWSGGTWANGSTNRKLPLADWKPIFDAVDATWVSLQYKDASEDITGTPVVQYPHGTLTPDYDDTAALVASCDLVIGVQTSVFHLAGALGVDAWVMIPKESQWRYGEGFEILPWYKSVKLFRQGSKWPVDEIVRGLNERY